MATAHPNLPEFARFLDTLRARCEAGAATYGDNSFNKPLPLGLQEIMDELVDQAGWAWCQWVRLYRIQQATQRVAPACILCFRADAGRSITPCANACQGWQCTRPIGHAGLHVACAGSVHRIAGWDNEDPEFSFFSIPDRHNPNCP